MKGWLELYRDVMQQLGVGGRESVFDDHDGLGLAELVRDGEVTPDGDITELSYGYWQADITKSADEYGDITLSLSQAGLEADGNDNAKIFVGWTKAF